MSDDRAVLASILEARDKGLPAASVVVIRTQGSVPRDAGSKMLVKPDGSIVGTVGGGQMEALVIQEALSSIKDGKTRVLRYDLTDLEDGDPGVCGGTVELYVEPLLPSPCVLVIGMGHVGKAVAELAKWAGLRVIAVDDRPGYATPESVPDLDGYIEAEPHDLLDRVHIDQFTYVTAVTRGLIVDKELIPRLLATDAPYIGLIGSRRRWAITAKELEASGVSREALSRIHAPIGLELNAETPQEIAVSILAEIVMTIRGGHGASMQWMGTPESASGRPENS